jgi:branched-subunit amino acid transport protein
MGDISQIWVIIIGLGIGTYLIRFSFLGIIGDRELPTWFTQHLNYVGVAVMPGLIVPFLVWPDATGGALDAPRLLAALAAFAVGIWRRSALWSVVAGISTLYAMMFIVG